VINNSFEYSLVEGEVGIAYDNDPHKAIRVISQVLEKITAVTQTPKSQVGVDNFADSSISISYRYWVPTTDLIATKLQVNLAVFDALKVEKIEIPFPQRIVTINKSEQED